MTTVLITPSLSILFCTSSTSVRSAFGEWGRIHSMRLLRDKLVAFVQYELRVCAEFAKEAMSGQTLLAGDKSDKLLNVRWATQDPNPVAQQKQAAGFQVERAASLVCIQFGLSKVFAHPLHTHRTRTADTHTLLAGGMSGSRWATQDPNPAETSSRLRLESPSSPYLCCMDSIIKSCFCTRIHTHCCASRLTVCDTLCGLAFC